MLPNDVVAKLEVQSGRSLSVLAEGKQLEDGLFELRRFVEGRDYVDPQRGRWVQSIGRHYATGQIYAAFDSRFYDNPTWECLFIRE
jgi:GH43 family beta-xylosidase